MAANQTVVRMEGNSPPLRHLRMSIEYAGADNERGAVDASRLDQWVVWRGQDDNGNRFEVARRDSHGGRGREHPTVTIRPVPASSTGQRQVSAITKSALWQHQRMANVWSGVTIDCVDPERVAHFWSALLDREPGPSREGWIYLGERGDPQPRLVFQPVPEPQIGKVRIHLDVSVDNIDDAMANVVKLGGRFTGERYNYDAGVVVVMADPEDHEFCLVQYYI